MTEKLTVEERLKIVENDTKMIRGQLNTLWARMDQLEQNR